jgi:hypothetical protein
LRSADGICCRGRVWKRVVEEEPREQHGDDHWVSE